MAKTLADQQRDLVLIQLEHVTSSVTRIETRMQELTAVLGKLRLDEMNALRGEIAAVREKVGILEYQAKRSGAAAGAWISAVISVVVAAGAALLFRH